MWVSDKWKGLNKDVVSYVDCKKHTHGYLQRLKSSNWSDSDVEYDFIDCVRRRVLAPFLFMELYPKPVFTLWGKSSGLLPKEGIIPDGKVDVEARKIMNFVDDVAYHTAMILVMMSALYDKCDYVRELFHKEKRKCHDLANCYNLDDAVKCLRNDEIYKIIRKYIPEDQFTSKMVVAVCAVSSVIFLEMFELSLESEEQKDTLSNLEEKMKDMGNSEYKDGDYVQAVASYTKIIKTRHFNSIIYNNRALAFLRLKKWAEAEVDGHRAVVLKPSWCKGYYCFVQALEEQDFIHEAHAIAGYGVSRCGNENCAHWDKLSENMMRLTTECKKCLSGPQGETRKVKKATKKKNSLTDKNCIQTGGGLQKDFAFNDVPDLVSDSESDDQVKKTPSGPIRKSSVKSTSSSLPKLDTLHEMLMKEWNQGSTALINNRFFDCIKHFQTSFNFISSLKQQNYHLEEVELVLVNYSMAVAHLEIGGVEELKKSVSLLEEIINVYKDVRVPCAYYKLGTAYYRMNKFEEALIPLTNGLSIIEKGILFLAHSWPGTDIIIEEMQSDTLKKLFEELIQKCRYPPSPQAVCRLEKCPSSSKNIFYSDPDFKGFCRVSCSESCHLEYHPHCWKAVKEKHCKKDKDFLGRTCLTPDCRSTISEIEIVDKDGLSKKFECDSSTTKQKDKHRKTKIEKKFEQKMKKKQKKLEEKNAKPQSSVEIDEDDDDEDESPKNDAETTPADSKVETLDSGEKVVSPPHREKENVPVVQIHTKLYEENAEPLYVIKKETENWNGQASDAKQARMKKKARRRNVMSAEEFCGDHLTESQYYNEYLNRVKNLQLNKELVENGDEEWASLCENYQGRIPELDPQRPFYVPEDLRNNPETLESILQSYGRVQEMNTYKEIRENIYSYMQGYLEEQGPVLKDSPALQEEIESFPIEAKQLIAKSGGLVPFLLESFHFAEVRDYVCVMKDVGKAYCLPSVDGKIYHGAYSLDAFDDCEMPTKFDRSPIVENVVQKCASLVEKDFKASGDHKTPAKIEDSNSQRKIETQQEEMDFDDSCENGMDNCDENDDDDDSISSCTFSSSTIRKLNHTLKGKTPASQFQLQVLVRSLNETQQNVLLVTTLNSLTAEDECSPEQLQSINKRIKGLELRCPMKLFHKNTQTDKVVISGEEVDTDIYLKLQSLQDENSCLQERITNAEDTVVRLQNQHSVKVKALEKEVHDLGEQFRGQKLANVTLEIEKEVERRRVLQDVKQSKQEQQASQNNIQKLTKQIEQSSSTIQNLKKECERVMQLLEKEKQEKTNLQDTLHGMLESTEQSGQRATKAEKGFLEISKMCGLLKVDEAVGKCRDIMNKMEEDKQRYGSAPMVNAALSQHEEDGRKYLRDVESVRKEFLKSCNEQLEALEKNGEAVSEFDLKLPVIPELPTSLKSLVSSRALGGPIFPPQMPAFHPLFPPPPMGRFSSSGSIYSGMFYPPPRFPVPPTNNCAPPGLGPLNRPNMMNAVPLKPASTCTVTELPTPPPVVSHPVAPKEVGPTDSTGIAKPEKVEDAAEDKKKQTKRESPILDAAAAPPVSKSLASYNNLTPIPLTSYDGLCDIAVEAKEPEPEKSGTGTLYGAVAKVPVEPPVIKASQSTSLVPSKAISSPQSKGRLSSHEKLVSKLQLRYPSITPERFDAYITIFRAKNNNKLSGLTLDQIVDGVASLIELGLRGTSSNVKQVQAVGPRVSNQKTAGMMDHGLASAAQRSGPAWERALSKKSSWKAEGDPEQSCCICFEEMSSQSMCKVECGHSFHSACVKEWLKKDSTCPLCRVYILLPDEFPSLG